jgi:hypothetical protein
VERAVHDKSISHDKPLALLEAALEVMETSKVAEYRKQPVLAAIVTQIRNLGHDERAEEWLNRMLKADPFDFHALGRL